MASQDIHTILQSSLKLKIVQSCTELFFELRVPVPTSYKHIATKICRLTLKEFFEGAFWLYDHILVSQTRLFSMHTALSFISSHMETHFKSHTIL